MSNLIGQSLGRYHILEGLGEGGMAIVYKAYDTRLESDVAVKVIRTERLASEILQRAMKRFEREAKSLAQLTHPNLVKVLDYGEYEGQPYLVMPYLPGGTLKQKMRGQPMQWQEAARLLIPIARALDYAHKRNLIHRDIKPSNILITESGEPMLTDFGVAKIIDEEATVDLTGTSAAVGTPEYMAPEQATSKNLDHRADIYALGIVLYEMVTGRRPFQADTPLAVLFKHASEPLPRPTLFVSNLPDGVEKVLIKALSKRPEDRYAGMGEFANALENTVGSHQSSVISGQSSMSGTASLSPQEIAKHPEAKRREAGVRATRQQTADTYATINQRLEDSTLKEPRGTRPAPVAAPASSSNWIRFWPFGLIAVLVVALIFALAGNANKGANSFPTETPVMATKPSIATEAPVMVTEPPMATEAPAVLDEITDAKGVPMRLVPAGEFTMGSENYDDEKPIHQVYLDDYYMDKYEVTNALYKACVNAGVCDPPHETSSYTHSSYYGNSQYDDYPVIHVEWYQSKTYCEWRGARLPTEAEWEKAARGTDGRTYPWGNEFQCRNGNFDDETQADDYVVPGGPNCDGFDDTAPVGNYESGISPYGIYDMAGNVLEWVIDWYSATYFEGSPFENPLGPETGDTKVIKGGSWFYGVDSFSMAYLQEPFGPDSASNQVGFRCAKTP